MWSESEIQNFKKIVSDQLGHFFQNNKAEKTFEKGIEKARNLDFSGVHDDKEAIDHICEKCERSPELGAYFKDNFSYDPDLTKEENFRNVLRLINRYLGKEEELLVKIFNDQEYVKQLKTRIFMTRSKDHFETWAFYRP